jgi:ElaB/YqjD/DUF883 family membrane-anchored ribosome-binding protein
VGETRSKTQLPMSGIAAPRSAAAEETEALRRGLQLGRDYAEKAARKIGAWAEENPGQVVLAGLAVGFVLGKLLYRRPPPIVDDLA